MQEKTFMNLQMKTGAQLTPDHFARELEDHPTGKKRKKRIHCACMTDKTDSYSKRNKAQTLYKKNRLPNRHTGSACS